MERIFDLVANFGMRQNAPLVHALGRVCHYISSLPGAVAFLGKQHCSYLALLGPPTRNLSLGVLGPRLGLVAPGQSQLFTRDPQALLALGTARQSLKGSH